MVCSVANPQTTFATSKTPTATGNQIRLTTTSLTNLPFQQETARSRKRLRYPISFLNSASVAGILSSWPSSSSYSSTT